MFILFFKSIEKALNAGNSAQDCGHLECKLAPKKLLSFNNIYLYALTDQMNLVP